MNQIAPQSGDDEAFFNALWPKVADGLNQSSVLYWQRDSGKDRLLDDTQKRMHGRRAELLADLERVVSLATEADVEDEPLYWFMQYVNGKALRDSHKVQSVCETIEKIRRKVTGNFKDLIHVQDRGASESNATTLEPSNNDSGQVVNPLPDAIETPKGGRDATGQLQPSEAKAYGQYDDAITRNSELSGKRDCDVYDWIKKNQLDEDETLPQFLTWQRQLRAGRNYHCSQKNTPRTSRPAGKTIVRADEI